jgi:hypothetical protein
MAEEIVAQSEIKPEPAVNPYAAYGLDADGNQIKKEEPKADPMATKVAQLESKLASAEKALSGTTDLNRKMEVIDRVIKAIGGGTEDPTKKEYMDIFNDLKRISPPGVRRALEILESNPNALEQLTGSITSLHADRLVTLNTKAHEKVVSLAKAAGFRGKDSAEMNKMVYPYERAITEAINANPKLKDAFVSGNTDIVEEVFNDLVAPHVGQRLREKQKRMNVTPLTKTPPFGKATPNSTEESKGDYKPNIHTPKGKADFHKQASARFFDKMEARRNEE